MDLAQMVERGDIVGDAAGLSASTDPNEQRIAEANWNRYEYGRDRGHLDYVREARRNERFYFGCGGQWKKADRDYLESLRRPVIELNTIFPAVNTAMGEQLQTRVDIAYRPRNSAATAEVADTLSKLAMQIKDDNEYPCVESQVYGDGIIQRRGYFDVRVEFEGNLDGEIRITSPDPLDIIPDPDAQGYDPKDWKDFIHTRFLSLDEIEQHYGREARAKMEHDKWSDEPFGVDDGDSDDSEGRNSFGDQRSGQHLWDAVFEEEGIKRYRVIDRQHKVWSLQLHFVDPVTRDTVPVPDAWDEATVKQFALKNNLSLAKFSRMRVRWTVTTRFSVLHDDWSPYKELTIVGYFPYFRRGKTVGMVDNAISPQELTNKSLSSELHILNSVSNSGWIVEEGSLGNMTPEQLEQKGAETGVVVTYKKGYKAPEKIQPTQISPTFGRMSQLGTAYINTITGMSQQEQGASTTQISGIAAQSLQMQAKVQQAPSLDNLAHSRRIVARRILDHIQQFYTAPRIVKITGKDEFGNEENTDLAINQPDPAGQIINDITLGEYGVVVTSTPISPTFEQTQFTQAKELRELGVPIPDSKMVLLSNLEGKTQLAKELSQGVDPEVQEAQRKMAQAQLQKLIAEIEREVALTEDARAGAVLKKLQAMYAAMQGANIAASMPGTAGVADVMLGSAGFVDADTAPLIPAGAQPGPTFAPQQQIATIGPENSHPAMPPTGMSGIGDTPGGGGPMPGEAAA